MNYEEREFLRTANIKDDEEHVLYVPDIVNENIVGPELLYKLSFYKIVYVVLTDLPSRTDMFNLCTYITSKNIQVNLEMYPVALN